jgi:Zn ribbon nucleic-acid-binding protein
MTGGELVEMIAAAGGVLALEGDSLRFRVPDHAAHLVGKLREHKPELVALLRSIGGRVSTFPHCPRCASYALYRKNNIGDYECLTCGLTGIEERTARRLM